MEQRNTPQLVARGLTGGPMTVTYDKPITFGRYGTAKDLHCTGIDFSEEGDHSWTSAPVAELDIQLPAARHAVNLQLDVIPFIIPERIIAQTVYVYFGGLFAGYCKFATKEVRSLSLQPNVLASRVSRLSFVIPTAISPLSLGISDDERELGICLSSITFTIGSE
jgi:hypothetical protein